METTEGGSTGGSGAGAGSSAAPPAANTDGTGASDAGDGADAGQAQKKKRVSKRATKREQDKRDQDHIIDRLATHANVWLFRSADGKLKVPVAIQFTRQDDKTKSFAMANTAFALLGEMAVYRLHVHAICLDEAGANRVSELHTDSCNQALQLGTSTPSRTRIVAYPSLTWSSPFSFANLQRLRQMFTVGPDADTASSASGRAGAGAGTGGHDGAEEEDEDNDDDIDVSDEQPTSASEVTVDAAPRGASRKGPHGRTQDSVGIPDIAYDGTGRSSTAQGWHYSSDMLESDTYSCKHPYLPDCLLFFVPCITHVLKSK